MLLEDVGAGDCSAIALNSDCTRQYLMEQMRFVSRSRESGTRRMTSNQLERF